LNSGVAPPPIASQRSGLGSCAGSSGLSRPTASGGRGGACPVEPAPVATLASSARLPLVVAFAGASTVELACDDPAVVALAFADAELASTPELVAALASADAELASTPELAGAEPAVLASADGAPTRPATSPALAAAALAGGGVQADEHAAITTAATHALPRPALLTTRRRYDLRGRDESRRPAAGGLSSTSSSSAAIRA
jgi:hypothetical protein